MQNNGASLRDRATRPADQAPAGLGDAASVPSADIIYVVAVGLSRTTGSGFVTTMTQSWSLGKEKDDAVGKALAFAKEAKPDFKIDDWIVTEIPASAIEARSDATVKQGAAEGESAGPKDDAHE